MLKDTKGQITIEAILILGFMVALFMGVTVPLAFDASDTARDTSIISDAKFATEQIAAAANTVIVNGSRRTMDVFVPGFTSGAVRIGTRICTNGDYINTTVAIVRDGQTETHELSKKLQGTGWTILSGNGAILENRGKRYTIIVEYKEINSTTANSFTNAAPCTANLATILP